MKSRAYSLLVIVAATAALAAGCGGGGDGPSAGAVPSAGASVGTSSITINDFKFSPRAIRIPAGARVKVTNSDSTAHTVTADDGRSFDSGTVDPGASTSFKAPGPGSYSYHCTIHPFMKGTLVVR